MTASTPGAGTRRTTPPSVGLAATMSLMIRRWPIVGLGLILTELLALGLVRTVPLSYNAKGSLLITLPPEEDPRATITGPPQPVNPMLGSRGFIGDVLITLMADPDAEERVKARGGTGTFKTAQSLGDAALVKVDTTGRTAEEAMRTWNATAEEASAALLRLQQEKHAPEKLLVTVDPLTRPARAEQDTSTRVKALVASMALGLALTFATLFGVERLSLYRQQKVDGDQAAGAGPPPRAPRRRRAGRQATDEFDLGLDGPVDGRSLINGSGSDPHPDDRPPHDDPGVYSPTGPR
jgi:hypothetical protein